MVESAQSATRVDLEIRGMHCAGCVGAVESALRRAPGVKLATVNLATESASVWLADPAVGVAALTAAVRSAGYDAVPAAPQRPSAAESAARRRDGLAVQRRRLGIALLLGLPVVIPHLLHLVGWGLSFAGVHWHGWSLAGMLGIAPRVAWLVEGLLAAAVLWLAGGSILAGAGRALRHRAANMDLLVALGALAAFASGVGGVLFHAEQFLWFADAAMIVLFVSVGKYLEVRARGRASAALEALFARLPAEALLVTAAGAETVPAAALRRGDRVRVAAHSAVPADGEVVSGALSVDESLVTGESAAVERGVGQRVLGGTRVVDGLAEVRVTAIGQESAVARIARLVEEAQAIKPQWQRLADRAAAWFVPVVLGLAVATFLFWLAYAGATRGASDWAQALERAITVLVVACPCAMGLAVPTAVLVGTTRAAELGVLVRNPDALEAAGSLRTILLDKTGTLTLGRPKLEGVACDGLGDPAGRAGKDLLRRAAALAALSEHPLSRALVEAATDPADRLRRADSSGPRPTEAFVQLGRPAARIDTQPEVTEFVSTPGAGMGGRVAGLRTLLGSAKWLAGHGVDVRGWTERADAIAAGGRSVVWLAGEGQPAAAAGTPLPRAEAGTLSGTKERRADGAGSLVVLALLEFSDAIHPEAAEAAREMEKLGVRARILSGDRHAAVSHVAGLLGIRDFEAELSPEDKLARVREFAARGERTIVVGDGVNDAAALAAADVGVAIGAGADVARETADICLIGHSPKLIGVMIRLSRASTRIMRQNLIWAFGYNLIMLPLAVASPLPPAAATAAMMFSSFSVVANSLRLRRA